jgi:hypothetical protein
LLGWELAAGRKFAVADGVAKLCGDAPVERRGQEENMKLPVDTSSIAFLCALEPQPVLDFETRQPRADGNGEPLYVVQLIALAEGEAEILAVKVAGMPSGIRQGHPVKVHGLVAQPWTMNDRSGVAFRAARIEPAVPAAKAS